MNVLMYTKPKTLVYQKHPEPSISNDGDVIIDVAACGICGSDMHAYLGHDERRPAPLILGHEVSGIVHGEGRRVTVNPLVTCGTCQFCIQGKDNLCVSREIISMPPRQGGFAEKLVMPKSNLIDVPDSFSLELAALIEPMACGWHASRIGLEKLNDSSSFSVQNVSAVILGGGAIGVAAVLALKAMGVSNMVIVEPNDIRHEKLQVLDVRIVHRSDDIPANSFNLVADCVGLEQTRAWASNNIAPSGVIAHIGLAHAEGGLNIRRMTLQDISFLGSYTYTANDFKQTAKMIFAKDKKDFEWVEQRDLRQGAQAFEDIRQGKVSAAKILLKP